MIFFVQGRCYQDRNNTDNYEKTDLTRSPPLHVCLRLQYVTLTLPYKVKMSDVVSWYICQYRDYNLYRTLLTSAAPLKCGFILY